MKTETAIVDGQKIRYLHGGSGRHLLFLHGWPANPELYEPTLNHLAKNFTVYAPYLFDLKCNGLKCIADCAKKLIEQLQIKDVIVVGISFGGAVASVLAREDNVAHLVLINTAGVPREASFKKMLLNLIRSSAYMVLHGYAGHTMKRAKAASNFFAGLAHPARRKLFREIKLSQKTHGCHVFQGIKARTTLVFCTKDALFPASNSQYLNKLIKNSSVAIIEGDHYWPYHKHGEFAETILDSLK